MDARLTTVAELLAKDPGPKPLNRATILNMGGEFTKTFITTTYFLANIIETFIPEQSKYLGLSLITALGGAIPALGPGIGTTYAHMNLNATYQRNDATESLLPPGEEDEESIIPAAMPPNWDAGRVGSIQSSPIYKPQHELTIAQEIALGFDWKGHMVELAAPILFAFDIASHSAKLPEWARPTWQFLAVFLGILGGYASYRTCRNNLRNKEGDPSTKGDVCSVITLVTEFISNVIGNSAWTAEILAAFFKSEEAQSVVETLDYKDKQFSISLVIGVLTAAAAAYVHYIVNVRHEERGGTNITPSSSQSSEAQQPRCSSTCAIKAALKIGDAYSLVGDTAASISFIGKMIAQDTSRLSKNANMGLQAGAMLFGVLCSRGDMRTDFANLDAYMRARR